MLSRQPLALFDLLLCQLRLSIRRLCHNTTLRSDCKILLKRVKVRTWCYQQV
jgi:hypothetical protein